MVANANDQQAGCNAADDGTDAATGGYQAEKPASLLACKYVGHEAPEDRDDKQIEYAEPDNKSATQPDIVAAFLE